MLLDKLFKKKTQTTEEYETDVLDFLDDEDNMNEEDTPQVDSISIDHLRLNILKDDHDTLNKLMLYILSPELSKNEIQKRRFKQKLMGYIQGVLIVQLVVVGIAFLGVCIAICFGTKNTILANNINTIFNFLQYYITAIIVEFIAMLFFIVKFVFDKSIVGLLSDTIKKK